MEFNDFKKEILKRAKAAQACSEGYILADRSNDYSELIEVIKNNLDFAILHNVIDGPLIEPHKELFAEHQIYCNEKAGVGIVLAYGDATVEVYGNATVWAWGNSTVIAYDNAAVQAYGNATVNAFGNAAVKAYDNATVKAYSNATVWAQGDTAVQAYGNATVKAWDNATVWAQGDTAVQVYDNATVKAYGRATVWAWGDTATVKAYGNAYITSHTSIECKLHESAIHRVRKSNTLRYASDNMNFEKTSADEAKQDS